MSENTPSVHKMRKNTLQNLVNTLPKRCGYAAGIVEVLAENGYEYTELDIYTFKSGTKRVPEEVIVAAKEFAQRTTGDIFEISVKHADGSVTVI